MNDATAPVDIAGWKPAPFALGGESVFAVGDVHGCARELRALLAAIEAEAARCGAKRRLIYLGDLIDRGPDTLGVLKLWAGDERARGVDRIDRLMGNHEQMMLLAAYGGRNAAKAEAMWRSASTGGELVLAEMRARIGDPAAPLGAGLLAAALGDDILRQIDAMRSHVLLGNTVFVHAGLDPRAETMEFLARPWTSFGEARWAWIQQGFLDWQGGFGGWMVVHGHTPPPKHKALTGQDDPHAFRHDRLGLDGGSARSGFVTAAQIENGRYRIFRAGRPVAAAATADSVRA
ncbi:MAG: metallophosphoesterase [Alphaproteobacteria bacterium]|nr:metallophosphoesterase [Alphaproteobacteria bacterium]